MHFFPRVVVEASTEEEARAVLESTLLDLIEKKGFDYFRIRSVHPLNSREGKKAIKTAFKAQWREFIGGYRTLKKLLKIFSPRDVWEMRPVTRRARVKTFYEKLSKNFTVGLSLESKLHFVDSYLNRLAREGVYCWVYFETMECKNEKELKEHVGDGEGFWVGVVDVHF